MKTPLFTDNTRNKEKSSQNKIKVIKLALPSISFVVFKLQWLKNWEKNPKADEKLKLTLLKTMFIQAVESRDILELTVELIASTVTFLGLSLAGRNR